MKLQKSKEVSEARGRYNIAVMFYISLFEQKYDLEFLRWVDDEIGGVAVFRDFATDFSYLRFSFDEIRKKIDYI